MGKSAKVQSLEVDLLNLIKEFKDLIQDFKQIKKSIEYSKSSMAKFLNENKELIHKFCKSIEKYSKLLKDVKYTNEVVEESLTNVLLAIRQNEYLQAWYPAQKGIPEMKVTGLHPNSDLITKEKWEKNVIGKSHPSE